MKVEVPDFKRCCCCLPLRYGIIAYGYIKMIMSALISIILLFHTIAYGTLATAYRIPVVMLVFILSALMLLLCVQDVVFDIVFLVGAHKKNPNLLRVFYIYSIVMLSIFTLASVVISSFEYYYLTEYLLRHGSARDYVTLVSYAKIEIVVELFSICVQAYFILLIRSEIIKLNNNCMFRFTNNATEAQCALENGPDEAALHISNNAQDQGTEDSSQIKGTISNNGIYPSEQLDSQNKIVSFDHTVTEKNNVKEDFKYAKLPQE